jgi:hypothetical protein
MRKENFQVLLNNDLFIPKACVFEGQNAESVSHVYLYASVP